MHLVQYLDNIDFDQQLRKELENLVNCSYVWRKAAMNTKHLGQPKHESYVFLKQNLKLKNSCTTYISIGKRERRRE
jgi:hypothetical protein